ncbi:hypothetical protein A2276_01605 [candidate division WOR-1 bacterium RIFOXYA12_FULL_43_27]|uniref:histidine kinase n=1 Tax=candidate division WOR-1 bacterium RIFOXYC2_FULL_46_14 TaxID=1802587 RepID=A0A1F4U6Q2_UNCSA|nr:MAG: hypothetical protein A2276_01605 [candidate division WOR-1 bacterium RIFOXYA12_FULL_43_27]OGC19578.1 MAG: hypothetical protein A2292_02725 [candidate division WOR-1 bacterium RIFOXYB2_FULL_46_45]OGC30567.1 MAG: hypothetical protein A2232_02725 [candidate division WOR-1 bacterium RIFOXYA2_FULL_46_56]OGC40634.1 MAG: hypothetical protein A2438_06440 [candidate division WOR-1 bacterium RIFOXYC2_FULL_46_14]
MSPAISLFETIGVFIEVFTFAILTGVSISFLFEFFRTKKTNLLLLFFLFFSLLSYNLFSVFFQLLVKYQRPFFELIFVEKGISLALVAGSFFIFLLINFRSRVKGDAGVVGFFSVFFLALFAAVAGSRLILIFKGLAVEPEVIFYYFGGFILPFDLPRLVFTVLLGLWAVASFINVFFTEHHEKGERILALYTTASCVLFIVSFVFMKIYQIEGDGAVFFFSKLIFFMACIGLALGEGVDPKSKLALNPLNYLRTRLLFKVIFGFVLFVLLIFGLVHLFTFETTRSLAVKNPDVLELNSLLYMVFGMLFTILVGFIFAVTLEQPLRKLARGTEAIASGDLSYHISTGSIDEVGDLSNAYNRMVADLKDTQSRLILSEKLIALGNMATGMAHEIRNPLVSLRTFTQLLEKKWEDPEFRVKFSQIVPKEIERINHIAESLLKFGRPWQAEIKDVDINLVIEDVVLLFEPEMKKRNITLKTKFADVPLFKGDAPQLVQAFTNVIKNAIEALAERGSGTIFIDTEYIMALNLKPGSFSSNEMTWGEKIEEKPYIMIKISDTGGGIPQGKLRHLFDPFFTSKTYGTGMGLPITLRVIEEHHGTIRIKNNPGEGVAFTVYIPL